MASSKPIPCGPCIEGKVTTKADIWCYNCDEGLCSTCSGHHKRYRLSRDHTTVDIKSYNPSVRAIKTECDKHGQQLNLYCPSHLMPCCDECISNSHSKCMGIKSLASIVEITKIEKKKKSVEKDVNSILHILDKIVNNKSQNIKRGEQEHKSIKEFIVKIRNEIDEHLTHLEKKIYQEADTILNQEKSKATDLIAEIEGKQKNLKKMQDQLHTVIPHASKLKSFLVVHQIEQQVHQCQRYIDDLDKDDRAKEFNIKMEKNNETEKNNKKVGSLGELTVVKSDMDLNTETGVRREAQWESIRTLFALTYPTEIAIKIFNMENETVTKVITLDKDCWGLSSSDDSLVVGLSDDEIRIIDLDGNTLKSIQVKCKSDLKYLVYCNDRVIYSDYFGEAVYCVDQSGQQIWQYKQDLSGPRGLCTDTNGNIIVADYNSHRIIVISKDGKESKVLLSDGLECPRCICLKHCESSGFICDVVGKNLTKFNFSSK
ncbi:E3 ubiquitin-protein ligase TRIM71-like [Mytilus edulis]|uniref:E3 ubiquitin-protein ligase TRIM71-like n=1 Tax=Mytilus edulis TaxID=6550 RepID=UPI0039EEE66A